MGKINEKKRLYLAVAAAAAVMAVIVLVIVLVLGSRENTYRSIRIVELGGSVTIDRENVGSLEASVNMNLVSGDHVSTSAGAYVVLRLDEDKYVMLGEQGAMKVEADGDASKGRTAIHLEAGSVLSEIQKPLGPNATYEIVTPSATMSVRGTVFEARRNGAGSDGNIEVLVYEGKVAVGFEGQEPVLYVGGEYTQFTEGETPQFLVERSAIRPDQMNSQMLQRLQRIEENGRGLDFGEANLEDLIGQKDSDSETLVADNSQVQESEENDNLPDQESQDPETAAPSPDITASEAPVSTERPRSSTTPAPTAAPKPSAAPVPAATPGPTAAPKPAETPGPTTSPKPAETPGPTTSPKPAETPGPTAPPEVTPKPPADPTQSPASSEEPVPSDKPDVGEDGNECTVVFYLPAIVKSDTGDDIVHFYGSAAPNVYNEQKLTAGSKITEPDQPTISNVPGGASDDFIFVGWVTEQNEKWDFSHSVNSNITLYPVWKDASGKSYYTVILSDPQTGYYRCCNVKEGSYLFDQPKDSVEYETNTGNGCPTLQDHDKLAWRIINSGSENNNVFWNRTQTVQGVTSLVADWR